MTTRKEKFSSQADPQLLMELKQLATQEGRQFQSVLDEAMRDYVAKKQNMHPQTDVMEAFAESLKEFDSLYAKLAK